MSPSRPSGWMLALLATAQLIIALDATIVFVGAAANRHSPGFLCQQLQWVVSAYSVAFGGFLLLGGRATDLLGKRRLYRVGQSLYALSSLAAVVGGSAVLLVLARAVQGVGGALLFPATLALINTHYAEGPARHRAFAGVERGVCGGPGNGRVARRCADPGVGLGGGVSGERAVGRRLCLGGALLDSADGERAPRAQLLISAVR